MAHWIDHGLHHDYIIRDNRLYSQTMKFAVGLRVNSQYIGQ